MIKICTPIQNILVHEKVNLLVPKAFTLWDRKIFINLTKWKSAQWKKNKNLFAKVKTLTITDRLKCSDSWTLWLAVYSHVISAMYVCM